MTECQNPYTNNFIEFYGAKIEVTPSVLIPRPETEILVEHVLTRLTKEKTVLDLCTGSGCIAIALKKKRPDLFVAASDICKEALKVAKRNAEANQVPVEFFCGDGFSPLLGKKFDAIVCNPPYIGLNEELPHRVKDYEPHKALFAGEDGLDFFRMLQKQAKNYLNESGKIFLEIGYRQGLKITNIFSTSEWSNKELIQDWASHDRFFFLEKS